MVAPMRQPGPKPGHKEAHMGSFRERSNAYPVLEIFAATARDKDLVRIVIADVVEAIEEGTHYDRVVVGRDCAIQVMSVPVGRYLAEALADVIDLDSAAYDPLDLEFDDDI